MNACKFTYGSVHKFIDNEHIFVLDYFSDIGLHFQLSQNVMHLTIIFSNTNNMHFSERIGNYANEIKDIL